MQLTFWHLALYADPPAKGQFALRIDGDPVWQLEVDIPKLEQVYRPAWIASRAYPAGARVQVHVHNHGANTWKLFDLTAGGSGD